MARESCCGERGGGGHFFFFVEAAVSGANKQKNRERAVFFFFFGVLRVANKGMCAQCGALRGRKAQTILAGRCSCAYARRDKHPPRKTHFAPATRSGFAVAAAAGAGAAAAACPQRQPRSFPKQTHAMSASEPMMMPASAPSETRDRGCCT